MKRNLIEILIITSCLIGCVLADSPAQETKERYDVLDYFLLPQHDDDCNDNFYDNYSSLAVKALNEHEYFYIDSIIFDVKGCYKENMFVYAYTKKSNLKLYFIMHKESNNMILFKISFHMNGTPENQLINSSNIKIIDINTNQVICKSIGFNPNLVSKNDSEYNFLKFWIERDEHVIEGYPNKPVTMQHVDDFFKIIDEIQLLCN